MCLTPEYGAAEDPEEGEEGELSDAPEAPTNEVLPAHTADAMDVDADVAKQGISPWQRHSNLK